MNYSKLKENFYRNFPVILFLGSLLFYSALILLFQDFQLIGDEKRYLIHAASISHGIFTPSDKAMWLWNGPGYPMIILPFVTTFSDPVTPIRLFNALILSLSLVLFYNTVLRFSARKGAVLSTIAFFSYFLIWKSLPLICTEITSIFLLTLLVYILANEKRGTKRLILLGFVFALLCMVKVVFGYVLTLSLIAVIIYYFFSARSESIRFLRNGLLIGLLFCVPWLSYTWAISKKPFYWGASGGSSLYWMSTLAPEEYGEWMDTSFDSALGVPKAKAGYEMNHGQDIKRILSFEKEARDDEYKRIALEHIRKDPQKYLLNVWCNAGRFFFNYPFSYYPQQPSTLINILLNGPLLGLMLFFAFPTVRHFKRMPIFIRFFVLFFLVYMGISFLLSAYIRMFYIFIPVLFAWLTFMIRSMTFSFVKSSE